MRSLPASGIEVGVAVAAVLVFAGCAPSGQSSVRAQAAQKSDQQLWVDYTRCLRQHGLDVPDPAFDDQGTVQLPAAAKNVPPQIQQACRSTYLKALNPTGRSPSAADITKRVKFAQCMRQHGLPDFPDPDPQGSFIMDRRQHPDLDPKSAVFASAEHACTAATTSGG